MVGDENGWVVNAVRPVYAHHMKLNEYGVLLPTGEETTYAVDDSHEAAVATLVVVDGSVILSRQYRFPLRRWIYDLPGGAVERGESPEHAAVRECREEVGLVPRNLHHLVTFYPNPGRSSWAATLYFSDSVERADQGNDDPAEVVKAVSMPVGDAMRLLESGEPVDAGLALALHVAASRNLLTT